jgi:hypothetical protein
VGFNQTMKNAKHQIPTKTSPGATKGAPSKSIPVQNIKIEATPLEDFSNEDALDDSME